MKDKHIKSLSRVKEEIPHQLERMLGSADFRATPQQAAFFKFIVNHTLATNADQIKGYTVATQVFGRGPEFDQSIDPVVSIQAARLRRAMQRYYATTGKNDPIRIDIPKGSYVPTFSPQLPGNQPIATEPVSDMDNWPAVLVRPLANLTDNPEDDYLSIGFTTELAHALSHYPEIRVLETSRLQPESRPLQTDPNFTIEGSVRRDATGITLSIRLCDAKQRIQIWSSKYQGDLESARMISFQENIAAKVSAHMVGGNALIPRHLSGLSRNKPVPDLTTYESMLRYWEYDTLRTRESYVRAIRALEHAVVREPDFGQTWSMLASLYADNYGVEMLDLATPLEKSVEFAERGVRLDPLNRRTRALLAYVRFMENKLSEARYEAEAAYHLCPKSLMSLDAIGWLMALAGEWKRGVNWIEKAIELNPYYRPRVRQALFLNCFRTENYERAYLETLSNFMMPEFHWAPLLKASVCGHLERIEEGQDCVRALLALKPDFAQRGRILISRYIKFEVIVERVIEGLNVVGIKVR